MKDRINIDIIEDRIKSDLELKLETEGWKWVTNLSPINREDYLKSYRERYGKILIKDQAFDIYGKPIKKDVAVYVRRK